MATRLPDGITDEDAGQNGRRRANPLPLLILTVLIVLALFGFLGGKADPLNRAENSAALIEVRAPEILRNGMFLEMVVRVTPKRPVNKLVIAVSDGLWREMTINSMIPAAEKEEYKDGLFRFSFGRVEAAETFQFKIDGQINPPLFAGTQGSIIALDDQDRLVELHTEIKVRP
ncbi:hypothetical protein [Sphingobium baderi]|uniref:Uncharacterized protein n=1 Tax=Sphingobium baderi LL03 TaxID=1114964 RepID=T0H1B2_9SPHN|nr:hypothetical protein [Sphingobium baderi]EQB05878.1 hypothetical protein L485_01685 [Sphingobium baderi LL03]KMS60536.1 hypothetical protein V475_19165 [Sphingobium baderi LL03]